MSWPAEAGWVAAGRDVVRDRTDGCVPISEVEVPNRSPADGVGTTRPASAVQSIERVFELLEVMADAGGRIGLSELAERSGVPKPTVHRLMRTLVPLGYVRQEPSRDYALGPRLARLVDVSTQLLGEWATPHLAKVVEQVGESANLSMLDGLYVMDVSQVAGRHAMRMVSELGSKAYPHCSAAGKAMLAQLPAERVTAIVEQTGLPRFTSATITDPAALHRELMSIRGHGYATDDEEQELGVRCVAVALPGTPVRAAVSIAAPLTRMSDELIARAVPILSQTAELLADEFDLIRATSG
jgi:IclR family acetate operon transcriptional repressor